MVDFSLTNYQGQNHLVMELHKIKTEIWSPQVSDLLARWSISQ